MNDQVTAASAPAAIVGINLEDYFLFSNNHPFQFEMDPEELEDQRDGEDSNDGIISCLNPGGCSLTDQFIKQRKMELLRASQENERRTIRENHLRRETFKIIESLVEGRHEEEYLIRCASLLSQSDFNEVHEERSLASFCGYPLCDNRLVQEKSKKKKQMFKIDSKNNQVYVMEEFNRFCCVLCYRSSLYLREQMSPEPLWMRYTDSGGYDELYQKGFETLKLFQPGADQNDDTKENDEVKKPASQKVEVTMKESVSFPYIKQEHLEHLRKSINKLTIKERNVPDTESLDPICKLVEVVKLNEETVEEKKDLIQDGLVAEEEKNLKTETETNVNQELSVKKEENQVCERLREWMTFDSFIFIFGNSIIDELIQLRRLKINDDGVLEFGQNNQEEKQDGQILRKKKMEDDIQKICKKLDDEEILDQLINETEQIDAQKVKVEAEVKRKFEDENQGKSKHRKSQTGRPKKVTFDPTISVSDPSPDSNIPHVLPLTSSKSQNKLRKQLFSRQLERTLTLEKINPEIVAHICPLMRELVDTFKFTSTNVVIAHNNWPELLLFLLKIVELKERNLNSDRDIAIMTERSVINLHQKIVSNDSLSKAFEENISSLLDYRNSY